MEKISTKAFEDLFNRLTSELKPILNSLDYSAIGKFDRDIAIQGQEDAFANFIIMEKDCYRKIFNYVVSNFKKGSGILDLGMFTGAMPLLLAWYGFKVTTVEKFSLYSGALDPIKKLLEENCISVLDEDIVALEKLDIQADAILLLNVIEHLHGSPKDLFATVKECLNKGGEFIVTVPNQARLIRRVGMVFGMSAFSSYRGYFYSSYPFAGHHREYIFSDLKFAVEQSGFEILELSAISYKGHTPARMVINGFGRALPKEFQQGIFCSAKLN